MNDQQFFLQTMDDLKMGVFQSSVDEYITIKLSNLLYQLLFDASPLVTRLNRQYQLPIKFKVRNPQSVLPKHNMYFSLWSIKPRYSMLFSGWPEHRQTMLEYQGQIPDEQFTHFSLAMEQKGSKTLMRSSAAFSPFHSLYISTDLSTKRQPQVACDDYTYCEDIFNCDHAVSVKLNSFTSTATGMFKDNPVKILDVIKYVRNSRGGSHRGDPKGDIQGFLAKVESIHVDHVPLELRMVRAIGICVLDGLSELTSKVRENVS